MACRVVPLAAVAALLITCLLLAGLLAGCSQVEEGPRRPAWRRQAEAACVAEHRLKLSRYVQPRGQAIDGPGICGLTEPFVVGALAGDSVQLDTVATLDCPMVAALDEWIEKVVQPTAQARFGQAVAQIDTMGSYSCRGMNGQAGAKISEHAFGNAIDVGGFRLADGRRITVVHDWTRGDDQAQAFLRDVHAGACNTFTTVLGPGSNVFHYNHIHVDLAQHGGGAKAQRHICKPIPQESRPGPREVAPDGSSSDEEQDVASAPPPPSTGRGERALAVATPPPFRSVAHRDAAPASREGTATDWDVTSSIKPR